MENDINTISLNTAKEWAARWRANSGLKGFWIPKEDIAQMWAHQGEVDIRAYLGVDSEGEPKLMLVGVVEGKDQINEGEKHFIYDFTKPCPNVCDPTSPLFTVK